MTIDRSHIVKAHFFEQGRWGDHPFGVFFKAPRKLEHWGHMLQNRASHIFCRGVKLTRHQASKITIECANWWRNRHVVIVENHQQIHVGSHPRIVHRLECDSGRHRTIANHRNMLARHAGVARGDSHAKRGRDRRRGVRGAKRIVLRFAPPWKAGNPAELTQRTHGRFAAGQNFVRIRLMANIPNNTIVWCVVHVMQRNR